jgi:predicted transcriptional regulator of viral defense system
MVQSGINTCAEIAEEMEVTRGRVSQLAKKAVDHGWLEIKKGKYLIRDPGQSYSQSNDP